MKKRTFTAILFLFVSACAFAAGPSKKDVMRAISVLETDVTGPKAAEAAKTIVAFAQASDDVMVDFGPVQLPWVDEKWGLGQEKEQSLKSLLVAAFVAGNIRSQIKNDLVEDDTYSGWIFVIDVYHHLREATPFTSPSVEALEKMQAEGTLRRHAKDAHAQTDREEAPEPGRKGPV